MFSRLNTIMAMSLVVALGACDGGGEIRFGTGGLQPPPAGSTAQEAVEDFQRQVTAATTEQVEANQRRVVRYPVCQTLEQIQATAAMFARQQLRPSGINFISDNDFPDGCIAATIPTDAVSNRIGSLEDRDGDWRMPVAELVIKEPEGGRYEDTFYGYALFPEQARLVRR